MKLLRSWLAGWLMRQRLDVPEVHVLLEVQARMLDNWAEADEADRNLLWRRLHAAGDALHDLTYGSGPTLRTWPSYWLRPYDDLADRRHWRWRPRQRCEAPATGEELAGVVAAAGHLMHPGRACSFGPDGLCRVSIAHRQWPPHG